MKYYIIAGEASGDLHASHLVKEMFAEDHNIEFRGFGGDKMKAVGVTIAKHYKEMAFMGFTEVVMHLRTILKNINLCKKDIEEYAPDAIILVDYPGFNFRIAPFAKALGIKVIWYISPQLWAWNSSRVEKIKASVDLLLVILPFEEAFYEQHNFKAHYVGHPLTDHLISRIRDPLFFRVLNIPEQPAIAVLPGSRKQEIKRNLDIMLSVASDFRECQFIVACAPGIEKSFYDKFRKEQNINYVYNKTYDLLQNSVAALVTSGTATLETALLQVPQLVCYKGSVISYVIAKRLIHVKYISLVNLILGKEAVPELIQFRFSKKYLIPALDRLLYNNDYRMQMIEDYISLREKLGEEGASERAAEKILTFMSS